MKRTPEAVAELENSTLGVASETEHHRGRGGNCSETLIRGQNSYLERLTAQANQKSGGTANLCQDGG